MPIVAQPMPNAGTIHGTLGKLLQPNQNRPTGNKTDWAQAMYSRPSGVFVMSGNFFLASLSATMAIIVEMIAAMLIAEKTAPDWSSVKL